MSNPDITPVQLESQMVFDTTEQGRSYLLINHHGTHIKVSASAYTLVQAVQSGQTFAQIAAQLTEQYHYAVSSTEVQTAYTYVQARVQAIESRTQGRHLSGFWLRIPLLSTTWVRWVTQRTQLAFAPGSLMLIFVASVLGAGFASYVGIPDSLGSADFWLGYGLFIASLIVHEFGHASACARYGAAPSDIGFAMYLIYPVFYSDVSAAWRLRRWQRVVVDCGGMVLQLAFGTLLLLLYSGWPWTPLLIAYGMIVLSCLFSLNPFLKFDGYWMLADILGIANLSRQPQRIFTRWLAWFRRQPGSPLPWNRRLMLALSVYSVASVGFWSVFVIVVVPILWEYVAGYPGLLQAGFDWLTAARPLPGNYGWQISIATFVSTSLIMLVWQRVFLPIKRLWRQRATNRMEYQ